MGVPELITVSAEGRLMCWLAAASLVPAAGNGKWERGVHKVHIEKEE